LKKNTLNREEDAVKTEEYNREYGECAFENIFDEKHSFIDVLNKWKYRICPARSSKRWQIKQTKRTKMPSLPNVRHKLAKWLAKQLL